MAEAEDDEGFMLAIDQTIEALTFAHTHVVDADFRAHSKTTVDSVKSLQEEQRSRVEVTFRGIEASPQYLADALLRHYRGEAAAVSMGRDGGGSAAFGCLDGKSDALCRQFKKDMKQRIHEWEGAFQEAFGKEASPQDKAPLRPVYELYKAAKARVLRAEGAAPNADGEVVETPASLQRPLTQASGSQYPSPQPPHRPDEYSAGAARLSHAVLASSTPSRALTTGSASLASSVTPQPSRRGSVQIAPVAVPAAALDLDALQAEKRHIKRLLHRFESDFEQANGRRPAREDRRDYAAEYHRYGELKALLNEQLKRSDD